MRHVPFADYDFCDFVALMLAAMGFVLCIYMEVGA
jgi:hypothetical protein